VLYRAFNRPAWFTPAAAANVCGRKPPYSVGPPHPLVLTSQLMRLHEFESTLPARLRAQVRDEEDPAERAAAHRAEQR
jgi:hypothetical protein